MLYHVYYFIPNNVSSILPWWDFTMMKLQARVGWLEILTAILSGWNTIAAIHCDQCWIFIFHSSLVLPVGAVIEPNNRIRDPIEWQVMPIVTIEFECRAHWMRITWVELSVESVVIPNDLFDAEVCGRLSTTQPLNASFDRHKRTQNHCSLSQIESQIREDNSFDKLLNFVWLPDSRK